MSSNSPASAPAQPGQSPPADSVGDQINQNIAAILDLDKREGEKITRAQRLVETISRFVGRPLFLGCTIAFVAIWILVNVLAN